MGDRRGGKLGYVLAAIAAGGGMRMDRQSAAGAARPVHLAAMTMMMAEMIVPAAQLAALGFGERAGDIVPETVGMEGFHF